MPSRRPLVLSVLVLWVGALCAWLGVQKTAFTVTGASPLGFPPPAQSPRAEIPRSSEPGTLGGSNHVGAEVMYTRQEYLGRKDNGHKFPAGKAAYQFPPPIPQIQAGLHNPETEQARCDREYKRKFKVCQRIRELPRRRSDCEYDAFRWRRSCYWKARPEKYKIHPNFQPDHPWNSNPEA